MRWAFLAAALLVAAGLAWVLLADSNAPPPPSCSADLEPAACDAAVSAVMRRGLDSLHPLITGVRVEPGSAPGADAFGHRATVVFDLLLVPGPTTIELHFDQGAHWGGESDRGDLELAAYALGPLLLGALAAAIVVWLAARRRPTGDAAEDATG